MVQPPVRCVWRRCSPPVEAGVDGNFDPPAVGVPDDQRNSHARSLTTAAATQRVDKIGGEEPPERNAMSRLACLVLLALTSSVLGQEAPPLVRRLYRDDVETLALLL